MKKVYTVCLVLLCSACSQSDQYEKSFSGFKQNTSGLEKHAVAAAHPNQYYYLSPEVGGGKMQSPINIISGNAQTSRHSISLKYSQSRELLKNLGHTVQLVYDTGSYITIDQHRYDLQQFHFHTPSEHLIDGITYPLEMHLVHQYKKQHGKDATPDYLVISLLFKEGNENPFLAEFMESLPEKEGQTIEITNRYINVNKLLNDHFHNFYHYEGSLTTHPYTEAVDWLVLKHVFEASPGQIEKLNRLEGNNARHIQALNERTVEEVWY